MSRVIPFHIPENFKLGVRVKTAPEHAMAKVIEFRPAEAKKPA